MDIQETVQKAFQTWSDEHSTDRVKRLAKYFDLLLKKAEEIDVNEPSQDLYDSFMADADSQSAKLSRLHVIKTIDAMAGTYAINFRGEFFNEPPFPTEAEACALILKMSFPFSGTANLSIFITFAAHRMASYGASQKLIEKYWIAWRRIRTYSFIKTGHMNYNKNALESYLKDLDTEHSVNPTHRCLSGYRTHRKSVLIILEIVETGTYHWKRVSGQPIMPLENPIMENVRQQYLIFLRENNYKESTIHLKDYIFRSMIKFSCINSLEQLFLLSEENIRNILKGFANCYQDPCGPVIEVRQALVYLYNHGFLKEDRSKMVMAPFRHHGAPPCYIPEEEDTKFYDSLGKSSKRNQAIILLARELGLRSSDIRNLTFSQIDWQNDKIRINQEKTGEPLVLPLLPEVGNAIYEYIRDERPRKDDYPYIFLSTRIPYEKMASLYGISKYFIQGAEIERNNGNQKGMHLYRRTLTNRLLIKKVPHQVITDTLGHKSKNSDKAYIPMEEKMLRECSLGVELIGIKTWEGGKDNG